MKQIATVKYQIDTYKGTMGVLCDENDEDQHIIAIAKRLLTRGGTLPIGYERFRVIKRED